MSERRIAVVIPSWNTLAHLPRCLASLRDQKPELELLVVDNGSSDGSVDLLKSEGVPHLALPRNLGFAAAVNLGVKQTAAPAILVLNADTELEPGCVETLLAALDRDTGLGGVQPRILQLEEGEIRQPEGRGLAGAGSQGESTRDPDAARIYSVGQALTRDGRAYEIDAAKAPQASHGDASEVFGVCGAACLLRRELFSELGGYDESYFSFYEDVDLNVRARIAGYRFEYVPDAVVWHVGNASWSSGFERPAAENARLVARNRLATQIKFMPLGAAPRIAAVEVGALGRAAAQRRLRATLGGKIAAIRRLPRLRRERQRLRRTGDLGRARRWLGAEGETV